MSTLQTTSDLKGLIEQYDNLVLVTYRGKWCPFCKAYLKELNAKQNKFKGAKLFVMSTDSIDDMTSFVDGNGFSLSAISDPNITMHEVFDAPISRKHPMARTYPSKAFLQPAVFILKNGELVFDWKQKAKLTNLGGASSRISIDEVILQVDRCLV